MITEQTFQQEDAEIQRLFSEAGWAEMPPPNEDRLEKIVERAIHERIAKESAEFVFSGFGAVLSNFAHAFLGESDDLKQNYKL